MSPSPSALEAARELFVARIRKMAVEDNDWEQEYFEEKLDELIAAALSPPPPRAIIGRCIHEGVQCGQCASGQHCESCLHSDFSNNVMAAAPVETPAPLLAVEFLRRQSVECLNQSLKVPANHRLESNRTYAVICALLATAMQEARASGEPE